MNNQQDDHAKIEEMVDEMLVLMDLNDIEYNETKIAIYSSILNNQDVDKNLNDLHCKAVKTYISTCIDKIEQNTI